MTIDEQAENIARLIIENKFNAAKDLWKRYTTGLTVRKIIALRERIEIIEFKISNGFDEVKNSETGDL